MFRNYLLVTFRNLWKNKIFTLINIFGLGIALAICIVAFFNHMFNYEFDRTHENFNEIYRITCFSDLQGREQEYGAVPATLGLQIKKDIPGVERSARLMRGGRPVKIGDNIFQARISFIDPEFLDIFTFPLIYGDKSSLSSQGNLLVSEKMSKTLFGNEFPVGKTISIVYDQNKEFTFTVSGVFADLPENSSFRIEVLTHYDNFLMMWKVNDTDWKFNTSVIFVQIPDRSLLSSIATGLKKYLPVQNRAREDFRINRFSLVPLKDVGSTSRNLRSSNLFPSLHPAALYSPPIMAIFILLIACFNYANTSIATFSRRLKEIGLRKTFGGQKRQLITQFMVETFIICFLALIVGLSLASFLVPAYSNLWEYMSIVLTFSKYAFFWIFLVLLLFLTGFIAGVYPAIYVSSFSPVYVLKGATPFHGSGKLSSVLLAMQFAISVMSLVMGISFARNADYQRTLDLGYDRDKLIVLQLPSALYTSYRNEIIANPKVISAAGAWEHIGWGAYRRPVKDVEKQLEVDVLDISPEYAQTMGLRLAAGRFFDNDRAKADRSNASIIVNQKLVQDFGWTEAVGKTITLYDTTKLKIIGVVEDFYTSGVWEKIEPAILRLSGSNEFGIMAVRANPEDIPAVLDFMGSKWKELSANQIFNGQTQEDTMQEEKDINGSILKVVVFLAIIASLLSLIGMYNLVSLDIIHRTKEVGIRKIQGAPVPSIMFLISRKFIMILIIASIIGCAGGYYMSLQMMDSIWDYFVPIGAGILLSASLIMFISTSLALGIKITRAALKNPADSLRYE